MPKLLQINVTANWGSTGKIAEQIGICAQVHGWESYLAYGRMSNPSQSHLIRIGNNLEKYFHYGEQRIRDNEGLCSRNATRRLIRQINEIKPDVVQLHNIHDHYLNYHILFDYLNETNKKVVWTFHDCWAFTGHCFHFAAVGCEKWKTECTNCPLKDSYPKTLVDRSNRNFLLKRRLFSSCKNMTIVSCSDWMAGFVKQSFLKDKDIAVIKNGVDLDVFKPMISEERGEKMRLLGVSSIWNKDKGLYDFYRLRDMLDRELFEIILVGLTPDQIRTLPDGIVGLERIESVAELVSLYSSASVLINPTYADTFPTVNLEALACGTPVLTYRTGGSPEAITNETGWVLEQGDLAGMASIISSLMMSDKKVLQARRKACRERAELEFNKDRCYENYIDLYDSFR